MPESKTVSKPREAPLSKHLIAKNTVNISKFIYLKKAFDKTWIDACCTTTETYIVVKMFRTTAEMRRGYLLSPTSSTSSSKE